MKREYIRIYVYRTIKKRNDYRLFYVDIHYIIYPRLKEFEVLIKYSYNFTREGKMIYLRIQNFKRSSTD